MRTRRPRRSRRSAGAVRREGDRAGPERNPVSRRGRGRADQVGAMLHARTTSVGVSAPGTASTPCRWQWSTTPASNAGETTNCAPASTDRRQAARSRTVPAPTRRSSPTLATSSPTRSRARGTVRVISTARTPPRHRARQASMTPYGEGTRTMATIPDACSRPSAGFIRRSLGGTWGAAAPRGAAHAADRAGLIAGITTSASRCTARRPGR